MSDNYPILLIHIMQLYGVMLLGNQFSCIYCLKRPKHDNSTDRQQKVLKNFVLPALKRQY